LTYPRRSRFSGARATTLSIDGTAQTWCARSGGDRAAAYACRLGGTIDEPVFHVTVEDAAHAREVDQKVRATFLAPPPAFRILRRADPLIARLDRRHRGFRQVFQFDLLGALLRCITAQQVNLRWAATSRRRMAEAFGDRLDVAGQPVYSLDPKRLAEARVADLRALQLTTRKAEYVVGVARAIAGGRLNLDELANLADDEIIARLVAIRGIGLWSAGWILARTLGRPRVVAGDLGVRKAVGLAYFDGARPSEDEVRKATAHWGDAAAVAQALLLHAMAEKTLVADPGVTVPNCAADM
jgi:DNA-3-methyladenine glycosylase II